MLQILGSEGQSSRSQRY